MKTQLSDVHTIKAWPWSATVDDWLLATPEERFIVLGDSAGLTEEDIEEKLRRSREIALIERVVTTISSSGSGSADFIYLTEENASLRREIEQIKQKLSELEKRIPEEKVIVLREIPREEAKEEIRQLFSNGRTLYYSDIAEELGLDLELVVDICHELRESGELRIDESALRA